MTKQQQDRLVDPFYPLFQEVIFSSSLETLLDAKGETVMPGIEAFPDTLHSVLSSGSTLTGKTVLSLA